MDKNIKFITGDGVHEIEIIDDNSIHLSMKKPTFLNKIKPNGYEGRFINWGKHFGTALIILQ